MEIYQLTLLDFGKNNLRKYDKDTIEVLRKIKYLLKDKGLTIKGVKKYLNSDETALDETMYTTIKTKNILKTKLIRISEIVKKLKK